MAMEASTSWADRLVILLGEHLGSSRRTIDWAAIEAVIGSPLPPDYKQISEVLGPGEIEGGVIITAPGSSALPLDFVEFNNGLTGDYRQVQEEFGLDIPFEMFPRKEGLIAWGYTSWGDNLFWHPIGEGPAHWSVVAVEGRGPGWFEFEGGAAEFLVKMVTGEIFIDFMEGPTGIGRSYRRLG
jgi:hypothetical protein